MRKLIFILGLILVATVIFTSLTVSAQDFSREFQTLDPSVVTIYTLEHVYDNENKAASQALGSGVLISSDGYIMTAAHVVHTAEDVWVKFVNGSVLRAEVISSVPAADVALIKLEKTTPGLKIARLGDSDKLLVGAQALVIGAPFGLEHSLSVGHISAKSNKNVLVSGETVQFIQTDAAINHGNSGGPIFNDEGEVVGIVSYIQTQGGGSDGIGFAVAINTAKEILFASPSIWTGFDGIFLSEELAGVLNVPQKSGLLIQRVSSGSIAQKMDIQAGLYKIRFLGKEIWLGGDIVLSVQGITCDSPHNFSNIKAQIKNLEPGQPFTMEVLRKGKTLTLSSKKN